MNMNLQLREMPYSESDLASKLHFIRQKSQFSALENATKDENWSETLDEFELFVEENEKFMQEANETAAEALNQRLILKLFGEIDGNSEEKYGKAVEKYSEMAVGKSKLRILVDFLENQPIAGLEKWRKIIEELKMQLKEEKRRQKHIERELKRLEGAEKVKDPSLNPIFEELRALTALPKTGNVERAVILENIAMKIGNDPALTPVPQKYPVYSSAGKPLGKEPPSARPPQTSVRPKPGKQSADPACCALL